MDDGRGDMSADGGAEVDRAALAARVRAKAEELRRAGIFPAVAAEGAASPQADRARAGPWLHPLAGSAEILPYPPPRTPSATNGWRLALARLVRRSLRWFLWPITARMSQHNRAVADVLAEHERQLAIVAMDAEQVQRLVERR